MAASCADPLVGPYVGPTIGGCRHERLQKDGELRCYDGTPPRRRAKAEAEKEGYVWQSRWACGRGSTVPIAIRFLALTHPWLR